MKIICAVLVAVTTAVSAAPATLTLTGDWQVKVEAEGVTTAVTVDGPETVKVADEKIEKLPLYNPKAAPYARGAKLAGVRAQECSVRFALDPESLVVRAAPGGAAYARGRDYEAELTWGCIGRLEGGAIAADATVFASYAYGTMRLDAVVLTTERKIILRKGVPHVANPQPPAVAGGEKRLANVWVTPRLPRLGEANLFPVLETAFPEPAKTSPAPAEKCLPKTMAKLNAGGKVRILAWGDSVTDAGYLPQPEVNRWQEQFSTRLRTRYPKAEII